MLSNFKEKIKIFIKIIQQLMRIKITFNEKNNVKYTINET